MCKLVEFEMEMFEFGKDAERVQCEAYYSVPAQMNCTQIFQPFECARSKVGEGIIFHIQDLQILQAWIDI